MFTCLGTVWEPASGNTTIFVALNSKPLILTNETLIEECFTSFLCREENLEISHQIDTSRTPGSVGQD